MPAAKDYTGMTFGKLTAVSYVGKSDHDDRRIWRFQCECGAFVDRYVDNLKRSISLGNTPTCSGCRVRNSLPPEPKRLEIAGQTFGKLTALQPTDKVDRRRYVIWEFQCECGRIVERSAGYIMQSTRRNRIVSCGDLACSARRRLPGSEGAFNKLLRQYKDNARRRGLSFVLTNDQARWLFQNNCVYCGVEPSSVAKPHSKSHADPFLYNGIDRINNDAGYVEGNVVSCCWMCNRAKGKFTHEEFLAWIQRIAQLQLSL